ncbi:MAG: methionyl-tRNA formyltransferase [Thermoleophilia bacterium]|nr:methionyl-tRNA formyltransferase [Thermoleophilia bacterium]
MNFAFAGSPQFAAWVLLDLDALGRRPSLVISQPDRAKGRGLRPAPPPAAAEAIRLGLECLQTDDINAPAVLERLRAAGASTLVVAAFGQLLSLSLLEGVMCLNVHASLLPAYRGAAPIERALAAGEAFTGVTIMRVTEALDHGPWALQKSVSIGLRDDAGSIARILALLGATGIAQVLTGLDDGTVVWHEQEGESRYAAKLSSEDCRFDASSGAKVVHDRVRSLSPAIGMRAAAGDLQVKIWRTWPYGQPGLQSVPPAGEVACGDAGRLVAAGGRLFVGCAEGVVEILEMQPSGKSRMETAAFLRGYGARLPERLELEPGPDIVRCEGP